jgi:hypothetical protein
MDNGKLSTLTIIFRVKKTILSMPVQKKIKFGLCYLRKFGLSSLEVTKQ